MDVEINRKKRKRKKSDLAQYNPLNSAPRDDSGHWKDWKLLEGQSLRGHGKHYLEGSC